MEDMFCFQCEQTIGCKGCSKKAGACGKSSGNALLQDELTGALIGLARIFKEEAITESVWKILVESLFATVTNVNFHDESIRKYINLVHQEIDKVQTRKNDFSLDYDMKKLWNANEDIRSLKSLILFGLRGMAAYAYHAEVLGYSDNDLKKFFIKALYSLGEELSIEDLLSIVLEVGKQNLVCMELLDRANTNSFGVPTPTKVSLTIKKGPFIVISGHDLLDLKLLLEQTEGKGINIYTHCEMLPAHAYPEFKKFKHLKGNYGTAWHNQLQEFDNIPAPILFTTNCLMPPKATYEKCIFTTGAVAYPNTKHIGEDKDFSLIIQKSLELGGFSKDIILSGINGGTTVTTGFGHGTVLSIADKVIAAVKNGAIKHFFLVGGCDGARLGRNYYTEFVKKAPSDTIILTLACGKYRFNDLDLGCINGIPRLMDMGQCNDAYSAIKVAQTLAEAFKCDINELPLSMILSWYEQKAVCILLTLLYLGIKNIHLGPTLPAFISPNVFKILVDKYNISSITTVDQDLSSILKNNYVLL